MLCYYLWTPTTPNIFNTLQSSSLQNCVKGSYAYLYANCAELYDRELASESSSLEPSMQAGPKSLDFWPKLISLVVSVIEEDKCTYTQVLNQYVIFADYNWHLFPILVLA